jgi:serine/threonine protein phosphatase PrpC
MSAVSPSSPLPVVAAPTVATRVPARPRAARVESFAATSVGRRESNEDGILHLSAQGLFAVADGMGGYEGGEVASQIVVETLQQVYERLRADADATFPWRLDRDKTFEENLLLAAIRLANRGIIARRVGPLRDMGSTVVAMALGERSVVLAHVGDSRIYRLRGQELSAMTRDHSLYEEARAAGLADVMRSKRDCSFANVITRALGLADRAEPDVRTVEIERGDVFLLCSDGLSDPLPEERLAELLRGASGPGKTALKDATEALIRAAYDAGGRDNISAVVVRVL